MCPFVSLGVLGERLREWLGQLMHSCRVTGASVRCLCLASWVGVVAPGGMEREVCQSCGSSCQGSARARIVTDTCGHTKCRRWVVVVAMAGCPESLKSADSVLGTLWTKA